MEISTRYPGKSSMNQRTQTHTQRERDKQREREEREEAGKYAIVTEGDVDEEGVALEGLPVLADLLFELSCTQFHMVNIFDELGTD